MADASPHQDSSAPTASPKSPASSPEANSAKPEPRSADSQPAEPTPKPAAPKPAEPDAKTADPKPTEPADKPAASKLAEPEPKAAEAAAAGSATTDPKSMDLKATDPKTADPKTADPKTAEPAPSPEAPKPTDPALKIAAAILDTKLTEARTPQVPVSSSTDTAVKVDSTTELKADKPSPPPSLPVVTVVEKASVKAKEPDPEAINLPSAPSSGPPSPMPKFDILKSSPPSPAEQTVVVSHLSEPAVINNTETSKPASVPVETLKVEPIEPAIPKPLLLGSQANKAALSKPDAPKADDAAKVDSVKIEVPVPAILQHVVPELSTDLKLGSVNAGISANAPSMSATPQILVVDKAVPNVTDSPKSDTVKADTVTMLQAIKPALIEPTLSVSEPAHLETSRIAEFVNLDSTKTESKPAVTKPEAVKIVEVLPSSPSQSATPKPEANKTVEGLSVESIKSAVVSPPTAPKTVEIIQLDPAKSGVSRPEAVKTLEVLQVDSLTPRTTKPLETKMEQVASSGFTKPPGYDAEHIKTAEPKQPDFVKSVLIDPVRVVEVKPAQVAETPVEHVLVVDKPQLTTKPADTVTTMQDLPKAEPIESVPRVVKIFEIPKPEQPAHVAVIEKMETGSPLPRKPTAEDHAELSPGGKPNIVGTTRQENITTEPVQTIIAKASTNSSGQIPPVLPVPSAGPIPAADTATAAMKLRRRSQVALAPYLEARRQLGSAKEVTPNSVRSPTLASTEPETDNISLHTALKPLIIEAGSIPHGPPVVIVADKATTVKAKTDLQDSVAAAAPSVSLATSAATPALATKQDVFISPLIITENTTAAPRATIQVVDSRPVIVAENQTATIITTSVPAIVTATAMAPSVLQTSIKTGTKMEGDAHVPPPKPEPKPSFFDLRSLFKHWFGPPEDAPHQQKPAADKAATDEAPRKKH